MRKRWISLLMVFVMVAALFPQITLEARAAASGTCGDNLTWTLNDGTLTISGTGKMDDYAGIQAGPLAPWRDYSTNITSIILTSGITHIGSNAFSNCIDVREITVPDSVTSLGEGAFHNCTALTSIVLSPNLASMGDEVFYGCRSLTTLSLPASLTILSAYTFVGIRDDAQITVDPGNPALMTDQTGVLYNKACTWLIHAPSDAIGAQYTIPATVTKIGAWAFRGCNNLWRITIPEGVTEIGNWAFGYCESLLSVSLPESLTTIGYCAFSHCHSLTGITVPGGVTSIGKWVFMDCPALESALLSDGLTRIESSMFNGCTALRNVVIPASVSYIESSAFYDCSNLANVYYQGTKDQWDNVYIGDSNECLTNAAIHFEQADTPAQMPAGYDFLNEDSYQFSNDDAAERISEKYFTTMYESAAAKELYAKKKGVGSNGLCFGIAYTTAAIYSGFPAADSFVTKHVLVDDEKCSTIRDLKLNSKAKIGSNEISLHDYIKYAYIYQWSSSANINRNNTFNNTEALLSEIQRGLESGKLNVVISLYHVVLENGTWKTDRAHGVLAVGLDGNDILIDDSNNTERLERLTIHDDGSWTFSGYGDFSFNSSLDNETTETSVFRYNTDITMPYSTLITGNKLTTNAVPEDFFLMDSGEYSDIETYIEGMDRVDADKMLLSVSSGGYTLNNTDICEISSTDGVSDTQLFWISNDTTVTLSGLEGPKNTVHLASDDLLMGADVTGGGNLSMTISSDERSIILDAASGENCDLSFNTTGENGEDVVLTISGTAHNGAIIAEQMDAGVTVIGIDHGTVTLQEGDEVVSEALLPDSNNPVIIDYDTDGGNEEIHINGERVCSPFTDVSEGSFYYIPVLWAVEKGITEGMTPTTFEPKSTCTRGQVVTFLWRAAGCPEPTITEHPFTDVKEGKFYYKAMLWAVEKGITNGTDATHFSPGKVCDRGTVVTFLHRAKGAPTPTGTGHPFTDVKEGKFYYTAMLWAVENNITSGTSKTTFAPNNTCTRGQVVTFLYRAYAE